MQPAAVEAPRPAGGSAAAPAALPQTADAAPATAARTGEAHVAGAHAHGSPHGGQVMSTPGGHVEARLERTGRIAVWILDDREQAVTAAGASATVRLAVAGAQDVALTHDPAQDALVGQVPPPAGDHVVGIVTVTRPGGQPTTVRYTFHLETAGH